MPKIDYSDDKYYENRELSWIKFNKRVLSEAKEKDNPLFERLKFLSITSSNLDEFIMVRVASLIDLYHADSSRKDIAGLTVAEQRNRLKKAVGELVKEQYEIYTGEIVPLLKENNIRLVEHHEEYNDKEKAYVDTFFEDEVYPVLTPMAVDSSRPFPLIRNKSLNIGALVTKKDAKQSYKKSEIEFATVQVPDVLPRIIELPAEEGIRAFTLLEQVIERNISKLFLNYDIVCAYPFRIMRSADLSIDEYEAVDLLKEIERQVRMRKWGEAMRLEIEKDADKRLVDILQKALLLESGQTFHIDGPIDLTFLMKLYGYDGFDDLKEHKYSKPQENPLLPSGENIFERVSKGDILLCHPYQSFQPVVDFIAQAAVDPNVLAIKQTLYRVSGHSPIIAALAKAAENGKQVTVLVELKARFDEENNINWARMLEQAGCHVIYGLVGLKTHSKITLVVRREEDGIARYVHLGTGNYNDSTAKLYTDVGLLTCNEAIGEDATAVFNMLSGYSEPLKWNKLSIAPLWLKDRFLELIEREKQHAMEGRRAHIIAKMNSVCDKDVICALYEAASQGVKIDLIVRGICCLKVGLPGIGDNIKVRSIVGNYLEHARIFCFENGGKEEFYCASADWMPRNLERRVEILFPVEKPELRNQLREILAISLEDNEKAHELNEDGKYIRTKDVRLSKKEYIEPVNSQLIFGEKALEEAGKMQKTENSRVFIPKMTIE